MANTIIYSVYDVYLIGIATLLTLITAIRYFGLTMRKENPDEKSIVNAYAWTFVFITIYLIMLNLSFFYLDTKYVDYLYRGNFDNPSLIYVWVTKGAFISYFAAFISYFYTYEKIFNKRIHLATFGCILVIILIIFLPYEFIFYQLIPIAWSLISLSFMHTIFILMKKSQRALRAATSFIIIGTWFLGLFMAYTSPTTMQLGDTIILLFPASCIVGIFFTWTMIISD